MTALDQLTSYLKALRIRFRVLAATRGIAIAGLSALMLTVLLVWISNRLQFAQQIILPMRLVLFAGVSVALATALILPLMRLTQRRVTRLMERREKDLEQRLLTVLERPDKTNPFTELLAEDALTRVRNQQPAQVIPVAWLAAFTVGAAVPIGVLAWLTVSGPGYWRYGSSLLWTGSAKADERPMYDITVRPGNRVVRRKASQPITAELLNFSARQVTLHAKHKGGTAWEQAAMQPEQSGNKYQFVFSSLPDEVEYFIQAGAIRSKHFKLGVKDLAAIKQIKVATHFPSALGLQDVVDETGGDIRAVKGSDAEVSVLTDRALVNGVLVLDNGTKINLTNKTGNWFSAHIPVQKDGSYHVAAIDGSESIRLSDDYYIEAKKDEPPTVKIASPGRDPHVSPIEELPVKVEASDDYGINQLDLHYSVNGGAEQVVALSKARKQKEASGQTTLYLENFKLSPGDLVSMYATARDAKNTSRSDIVFAQADPFDLRYSQSQQAGGGGGGMSGEENEKISERQKEIIAATSNELKSRPKDKNMILENSRFLSQLEGKLSEQAQTMAQRMDRRELAQASAEFESFSKAMIQASESMRDAVVELKSSKWQAALPPEQRALQSLLRAEATFRNIQVAFGQSKSAGGGGSSGARDLERMLDLELDKNKNQYETGESASAAGGSEQQKSLDDAAERLKMLARRQQELAAQKQPDQAFEQRWQQEQLRREAEQLRQQLQQLAKNNQQQSGSPSNSQSSDSQSSESQQSSNGQSGESQKSSSGQSSSGQSASERQAKSQRSNPNQQNRENTARAMAALKQAEEQMRKAMNSRDGNAGRQAAEQLADAQKLIQGMQQSQSSGAVSDLARKSRELAGRQKGIENKARSMYGLPPDSNQSMAGAGDGNESMPPIRDPRYSYLRRYWQQQGSSLRTPQRNASRDEASLAAEKEKLGDDLEQLQRQVQRQAQQLQGNQPGVSSKLRKALGGAEQDELALRMKKSAEWMRDGFGASGAMQESSVTRGLDRLARGLDDAQKTAADNKGNNPGQPGSQKTEQALAQVRKLRQALDEQRGKAQPGSETGSGKQTGGQQQSAKGGQTNSGSPQASGSSMAGSPSNRMSRGGVNDAVNSLSNLRRQLGSGDRELTRQVDGALGTLRHLNDSKAGELDARLSREVIPGLERLELELTRRVSQDGAVHTNTGEAAPAPYRQAVSNYFKKLSQ